MEIHTRYLHVKENREDIPIMPPCLLSWRCAWHSLARTAPVSSHKILRIGSELSNYLLFKSNQVQLLFVYKIGS